VPERPGAVGRRALGGAAVVVLLLPLGEPLGVDDVVRGQDLGVLLVLVVELVGPRGVRHVQHALRVRDLCLPLALGPGPGQPFVDAEEFGRLVEQGYVRHRPPPGHRAADGGRVLVGEVADRIGEEVRDQPLRGQSWPQLVDGGPDFGVLGELVADLRDVARVQQISAVERIRADAFGDHVGERVEDVALEVLTGRVVRQPGGPGALPGDLHQTVVQHQDLAVVLDRDHRIGQGLPAAYDVGEDVRHGGAPLHRGRRAAVGRRRLHTGEELPDRREQHTGLAQ
jgi:hypothetical protein